MFAEWMHGRNVHFPVTELNTPLAGMIADLSLVLLGEKKIEDVLEQYRNFIHLNSETYNPREDFDNPTPEIERYVYEVDPNKGLSTSNKWREKPENRLDASIVAYGKVKANNEKNRARERVKLADKDLFTVHMVYFSIYKIPIQK